MTAWNRRRLFAGAIALVACAVIPANAEAAVCSATDGTSLTASLADVNCSSITLAAGSYSSGSGFTAPARTVAVTGPGSGLATITRTGAGDVFTVPTGANLSLGGVTIGGASNGAGLNVTGTGVASLSGAVVSGNSSSSNGAGIAFSGATLTVARTEISGNSTTANGGGAENSGIGTATFHEVLFKQNTASGAGGGGAFDTAAVGSTTNFKNVTFTANSATVDGGAVRSGGAGATTNLNNVTIAGNTADSDNAGGGDGGGLSNSGGTLSIGNSIVANNSALGGGAPDCDTAVASPLTRAGYELIRNATGCTFAVADSAVGYLTGVDPLLGPLATNGGTTQTMALLLGSPAINAGNPAAPSGSGGTCEGTDQRNQARAGAAVLPCDLGAFEVHPAICHNIFMTIGSGAATPVTLDCAGDPFIYAIATSPAHGAVSGFSAPTGTLTYTPNPGFAGTDSFSYQAVNGPIHSSASVTFSVKGPGTQTPGAPALLPGFNLKKALKRCKTRVPKGPKRTRCIKKAKKRAKALD